jgi:hypothetical protein
MNEVGSNASNVTKRRPPPRRDSKSTADPKFMTTSQLRKEASSRGLAFTDETPRDDLAEQVRAARAANEVKSRISAAETTAADAEAAAAAFVAKAAPVLSKAAADLVKEQVHAAVTTPPPAANAPSWGSRMAKEVLSSDLPPLPSTPPPPRSASVYTASAYTGSPASPAVAPSPIGSKAREAEAAAFEAEQEAWWRDEEARKHAETAAWRDEQRIREEQQRAARKAAASENASARRPFMAPVAGSGVRVEAPPAPAGAAQEAEPEPEDEYEWWGVAATVAAGVAVIALLVVGRR